MKDSKTLLLLSSIVIVLMIFSYGGNYAWSAAIEKNDTLPSSVMVGNTEISGMSRESASELLEAEVAGWKESGDIRLDAGRTSIRIPASFISFETETTLENISGSGEYAWSVKLATDFDQQVLEKLPGPLKAHFQMDRFKEQVKIEASRLPENKLTYNAYAFIQEHTEELYEQVATYSISITDTTEIGNIINRIDEWRIPGKSTVSLLDRIGNTSENIDSRALSQVSTAIYGSLLETPFITEERHISLRLPDYADAGKEAAVDASKEDDLKFRNTASMDYYLKLSLDGSKLQATWTGYPFTEKGRILVSTGEEVESRKTIRYSTSVTPGTENVLEEGKDGRVIEVYREQPGAEERELLSEDYYPPVDTVVERYPVEEENNGIGPGASPEDEGVILDDSDSVSEDTEASPEEAADEQERSSEDTESDRNNSAGEDRDNNDEQNKADSDPSDGNYPSIAPPLWEPGNDKK